MKTSRQLLLTISLMAGNLAFGTNNSSESGKAEDKNLKNKRPNILFCIADDATYLHFSKYGCKWVHTPSFDRVANNGILFSNAYTPNAKSAPSRACLLTGLNSWQLEEAGNHIGYWPENKYITFMEALSKQDYFVGFTGKPWAPGNMRTINGKPRELNGKAFQSRKLVPPTKEISSTDYSLNFEDFLKELPTGKPWCFWYGGHEPHRAYEFKAGVNKGGKTLTEIGKVPDFWPDNDSIRNDMLDYAYEIEYFDNQLGKLIQKLEFNGELENTIIVVTADNGMPFPRSKGIEYEYSNHIPLAIMWPKGIKNPGRTDSSYISFIDIAPTFIEAAGLKPEITGMSPMQGKSIVDIFSDTLKLDRSYILLGQERHDVGRPHNQGYPVRSIIQDGFLYIYNFKPDLWPMGNPETGYLNTDGSPTKSVILNMRRSGVDKSFWKLNFGKHPQEEMYQISVDKDCLINLSENKQYLLTKDKLKKKLFSELVKQKDPRVLGNGDIFDHYQLFEEPYRDFYERFSNGEQHIADGTYMWVNKSDYETEEIDN